VGICPSTALGDVFTSDPAIGGFSQGAKLIFARFNQGGERGQAHVIVTGLTLGTSKLALRKSGVFQLSCELIGRSSINTSISRETVTFARCVLWINPYTRLQRHVYLAAAPFGG
jgi:hypothetical protein